MQNADVVIVEVNEHMPKIHGGYGECIHVSEVDYIVEGKHEPFTTGKPYVPSEIDRKIAQNLLPYICDGAIPAAWNWKYAQCSWRADSRN